MDDKTTSASVGVVVLTYNAGAHLERCLPPLLTSSIAHRLLVVDSSSTDGSAERARGLGAETLVIDQREFNHGATREHARHAIGTDIVVFMTQDAYPVNSELIEAVTAPVRSGQAAIAYARQIARPSSGFFEEFPRRFNYPAESHVRGIDDIDKWGSFLYFCSNACAAWSNAALDQIGGFAPTLSHEDAIAVALLVGAGRRVAYAADAVVEHSHRYTLRQELERYFDAGYARSQYRPVFASAPAESDHGRKMARAMFGELLRRPHLIPYGVLNAATKWLGHRLGSRALGRDIAHCRRFSGQSYFWDSPFRLAAEDRAAELAALVASSSAR